MRCDSDRDYLDVYFSRVFHRGETVAEVAKNTGERSFDYWLASSIHTVKDLSVERGLYFSGIILTNKDKEHQKIMFLNVSNSIPIVVGDILNWNNEKWIIFQKEKKVNETYQTFYIVRCNYLVKWVDELGHIQSSWCFFTSSMDSKIKDNFRTWHSLITPQPNKYAEIIMPKTKVARSTSFIIEDEAWYVVEYDWSSVPGIIYLSLTEEKVNMIYDDLENDIADTDKIAKYSFITPDNIQIFELNQEIKPIFTIYKDGVPIEEEYEVLPQDKKMAKYVNGILTGLKEGETSLVIQLKKYPFVKTKIDIKIGSIDEQTYAYLEGNDNIKLDTYSTYYLKADFSYDSITYSLDNNDLATLQTTNDNKCVIHANNKNKLGYINLTAECNGKTYAKKIKIIPLW